MNNVGLNSFPNHQHERQYAVATYGFNPTDATTYYFSGDILPPQGGTTNIIRAFCFQVPVVITGANIELHSTNAGASGETIPLYIHVNGTTDYLIQDTGFPQLASPYNQRCTWYNNNMNILLGENDFFVIKMVCPTWVTNPTNACFTGIVTYKTRT
jgi:hypothetical protein